MIKKEARILGISAPTRMLKRIPLIGIVFRGNLWLDGILTCKVEPDRPNYLSGLVRAIVRSKQYSQIHAVILSRENLVSGSRIGISDLSRKINLPVICVLRRTVRHRTHSHQNKPFPTKSKVKYFTIKTAGGLVSVKAAGLDHEGTRQIFHVACREGARIPEAVRVADVVARHVTRGYLFPERKGSVNRTERK